MVTEGIVISAELPTAEHEHERHKVGVHVDGQHFRVKPGPYVVSAFKAAVQVPPQKELDQVVHHTLTPLDDNATIVIEGHERFVSHERTGGSS